MILLTLLALFIAQGVYRNWDVYTGKRTTYDALAPHLNEQGEIDNAFPDDSQFKGWFGAAWKWYEKHTKPWFAFGPDSRFGFSRFREFPSVLIALGDKGSWRYENDKQDLYGFNPKPPQGWYLSRVQYQKRWHFQVQWPGFVEFQVGDWEIYLGFKRDADRIYWLALYVGKVWK